MITTLTDYTLDLETMGTNPTSAIIAMGAIAFNRKAPKFNAENCAAFYVNINLQDCLDHGLTVDGNTIMWWLKQNDPARSALINKQIKLQNALEKLNLWVRSSVKNGPCWTHATFDAPIISNAYMQLKMQQPTPYKQQRDIRTLNDLQGFYKVKRIGTHHNALDDALFQAEYIWGLLNYKGI